MKVLLAILLGWLATASAFRQCPAGWTYALKKCYKFFPMPLIKEEASVACAEVPDVIGGKLLDITDYNNFKFVKNFYTHTLPFYQPPPGQQLDFIPSAHAIWTSLVFDLNLEQWTGTNATTPFNRFNNFNSQPIGQPPVEPLEILSCTVYPAVTFPQSARQQELTPLETPQQAIEFMTLANCETELPYICEAPEAAPVIAPPTTAAPTTTGATWGTTPMMPQTPAFPNRPGRPGFPNRPGQPGRPQIPGGRPQFPGRQPFPGGPQQPHMPGQPHPPHGPHSPHGPHEPHGPHQPPHQPHQPYQPHQPHQPYQPHQPHQPHQPPHQPYPGFPSRPNQPGRPNRPGFPGQNNPSQPNQPQWPNRPNNPGFPSRPNQPQWPGRPNQPQWPNRPNQPQWPSRPNPGRPNRPNQPVRYVGNPDLVRPYEYRYNNYVFSNKFAGLGMRV